MLLTVRCHVAFSPHEKSGPAMRPFVKSLSPSVFINKKFYLPNVLLTKSGPLGTRIHCPAPFERVGLLTHLKFENRLKTFRPQPILKESYVVVGETGVPGVRASKSAQEVASRCGRVGDHS